LTSQNLSHIAAFADLDHFGDFNEMILNPLAAVETRGSRLFDHRLRGRQLQGRSFSKCFANMVTGGIF